MRRSVYRLASMVGIYGGTMILHKLRSAWLGGVLLLLAFLQAPNLAAQSAESAVELQARLARCDEALLPVPKNADTILKNLPRDAGVAAAIRSLQVSLKQSGQLAPNVKMAKPIADFRAVWLPVLKANDGLRESLVRAMETELRVRSTILKERLRATESGSANIEYDAVVVGAGVHGVIALHELLAQNPALRVLVIEASDTAAANFTYAGDIFNINSSNRASGQGTQPLPGKGNINELPGLPIQLSDLAAVKYPTAGDLGDTLVAGLYAAATRYSGVDVLFTTDAKVIDTLSSAKKNRRFRYAVTAQFRSRPASRVTVNTKSVIVATGLGEPRLPNGVVDALKKYPELVTTKDMTKALPRLMTFEDVMRVLARSNYPRKYFENKTVAVVGTGDSANVMIEFLLGYAPSTAYGFSDAQTAGPKLIAWVGQDVRSCNAFIAAARSRYAQIGTGFRNSDPESRPVINPIIQRLERVSPSEKEKGKINLKFTPGPFNSDVDIAIIATGYEGELRRLFRGIFPDSGTYATDEEFLAENFTYLLGRTTTSENETRIARALMREPVRGGNSKADPTAVIVGPAAGPLAQRQELVGIVQNSVSVFNNAPRTIATAKFVADSLVRVKPAPLSGSDVIVIASGDARRSYEISNIQETRVMGIGALSYLQSALVSVARKIQNESGVEEIRLEITDVQRENKVVVKTDAPVNLLPLVRALAETREFFNQAAIVLRNNPELSLFARLRFPEATSSPEVELYWDRYTRNPYLPSSTPVANAEISLRGIEAYQE